MRSRFVRYGRLLVKVAGVPVFLIVYALAARHAAMAAGLPQTPEQEAAIRDIVNAAGVFAGLALGVIGITGGLQQLFDGLPDFTLGKFQLKGGVWGSFAVGALLAGAGYASGKLDVVLTGDGPTDLRNLWLLLSMSANMVYQLAYGSGEQARLLKRLLKSQGVEVPRQ